MLSLKNPALFQQKALINGSWRLADDSATFEVTNPANGEVIGVAPNLAAAETTQAIEAAEVAFKSWRNVPARERSIRLQAWYQSIIDHQGDLAQLMVTEQGKPLAEAQGEVLYAANFVQWFGEQAKRIHGMIMADYSPNAQLQYTKEPVGVVGVITPWNFPLAMITRKIAPALASGCTCVIKPSELTPYSALALAYLAELSGIPKGVINVITSQHSAVVGETITRSKLVRKISFTGSTRVGKLLFEQSASSVKRMSLELGGNAPFIIFEDADLPKALDALMISKFRNTGQTCVCANRVYVQDAVYETFADMLIQRVKSMKVGNGFEDGVQAGPLISEASVAKVERHIQNAVSMGALVAIGGKRHALGGTFFEPTVLTEVPHEALFSCEESFGPIAPLIRFHNEADVIAQANDTEYGLASYFFTQDHKRIHRVLNQLESGIVGVNEGVISTEFGPFGGTKESGLGREGSLLGIEEYLETKYAVLAY